MKIDLKDKNEYVILLGNYGYSSSNHLQNNINNIETIKLNNEKNCKTVIDNFSNNKALEIYKEIFKL